MSLIEILVVLAIIALIMGGVSLMAFKAFDRAKYRTAAKDIGTLNTSVVMFRLHEGRCPTSVQDMVASGIVSRVTRDPWGADYVITCPGEHEETDISSAGKDGELGNDDDVNSWAVDTKAEAD